MQIDREQWKVELLAHAELFERMYDRLPKEFIFMRELLLSSLWRSPEKWKLGGALATNILVVNNLRDSETDRKVGKKTLGVRFASIITPRSSG